ncbi:MAG: hypothetical protein GVY12_12115 [Bacteroidetes bacterium]|jgi:hypothetical protein|nr:hypothetical protein [Bacteroidota bacterium]
MSSSEEINYTKEALFLPWNLVFIATSVLIAATLGWQSGIPWLFELLLTLAAGGELLYLGTMPQQERFRRYIRSKKAEAHAPPSNKEIYRLLSDPSQRRYAKLRKLRDEIAVNYRKLSYASQGLLDSHVQKLDGLLDSYLNLTYQKERYERHTRSATQLDVEDAIAQLQEDMKDDSPRVRAIKERRLRILKQRLRRFQHGRENLAIIDAQLETIEDVVRYIHEQSMTLRNPEEITFQLDMLLDEVHETEASVDEIESVFAQTDSMLDDVAGSMDVSEIRDQAPLDLPETPEQDSPESPEQRQQLRN